MTGTVYPTSPETAVDVTFAQGLVGLAEWRRFSMWQPPAAPLFWLLQLEGQLLPGLSLVRPATVWPDYQVPISEDDLAALGAASPDDVDVYCTTRVDEGGTRMTANLLGPILVNPANGQAVQTVLYDTPYTTNEPVEMPQLLASSR